MRAPTNEQMATIMGRVDFTRQAAMDEALHNEDGYRLQQRTHIIIGCGGVGSWLGLMLAMNGAHDKIALIDGQKLEPSNMNRIPCPPTWVGQNKAVALRRMIKFLRPQLEINVFPSHLSEDTLEWLKMLMNRSSAPIIWDCTDDARIQTKVFNYLNALRTEGYRVSFR